MIRKICEWFTGDRTEEREYVHEGLFISLTNEMMTRQLVATENHKLVEGIY